MPNPPAGMMGQMTPEQAPVQPSAEPQAAAPSGKKPLGYNGTVTFEGESAEVVEGVLHDDDGETLYVSDNGEMVINADREVVGYVKNGQVFPLDDEHEEVLRQMGVLE